MILRYMVEEAVVISVLRHCSDICSEGRERSHKKSQSHLVYRQRFEPVTCRVLRRIADRDIATFVSHPAILLNVSLYCCSGL